MHRDFITIVSGLPRSGTSMLMRMLEAGGVPALTDRERGADEDNPLGYYELESVKLLPDGGDWLHRAGGRAVKVISALLGKLPAGYEYRIVFLDREIREVLASQRRMLERRGEPTDRVPDDQMAEMFRRHVDSVLGRMRERTDVRLLRITHADVLGDPVRAASVLDDFLGGGLDRPAMASAVDASLWRQRYSAPAAGRKGD
ncbi:MAG TPA: hypothetical protein VN634_18280 [Candidatus Limnocylindrales bacterium]|nr:hypothetical protein [Candidatus Limnocylindrales bacterium]